jgi:hypothetical protein
MSAPDRSPGLSAWEVCGATRVLPAESVTCGDHDGRSVSDRDYPRVLLPSGTQRARPDPRIKRPARQGLRPSEAVRRFGGPAATSSARCDPVRVRPAALLLACSDLPLFRPCKCRARRRRPSVAGCCRPGRAGLAAAVAVTVAVSLPAVTTFRALGGMTTRERLHRLVGDLSDDKAVEALALLESQVRRPPILPS